MRCPIKIKINKQKNDEDKKKQIKQSHKIRNCACLEVCELLSNRPIYFCICCKVRKFVSNFFSQNAPNDHIFFAYISRDANIFIFSKSKNYSNIFFNSFFLSLLRERVEGSAYR